MGAKWGLKISPQGSGCECSTTQALWGETGAVFVSGIPKSPTLLLTSGVVARSKTDPIQDPYKKRKHSLLLPVEKVAHGKM